MKSSARQFALKCALATISAMLLALPVAAQVLVPQITTNKGCQETGDDPVFAIGERITVSFRVGSASVGSASASIVDHTTNGQIVVLSFGQVATNVTYAFKATVGGPAGDETLVLRAARNGASTDSSPCSFTVAGAPPPTGSPHPTRTPTATKTPSSATPTRTVNSDLTGELHTSRGCREDGDSATFAIGEPITLALRLDSNSSPAAFASIVNSLPNGVQTVISFGALPTNLPLLIGGRVGPPPGVHTLRLRGAISGPQMLLDTCSFLVAGGPLSTPTHHPTRTRTPTRTFTPVPGACVGACAQPGMVTVNDLLTVIQIAAGQMPVSACPSADPNHDGQVSLEEVLQAVNNALDGCPGS